MKFQDLMLVGGVFSSLITSIVLFTRNKANRLLGVVIFSWGWYAFLLLIVVTGWIIHAPYLYRIGSPLYYLIPPCGFLYVRSLVFGETKFRKWDWLHFIPAFLNLIDLIPFYLTDFETKKKIAESIYQDFSLSYQKGSGIFPAFWHFQLRWIQGIIYLVLQCQLLIKVINYKDIVLSSAIKRWLITFTSFCALIYIGLAIMSIIAWINLDKPINILTTARSIPTYLQLTGFMFLSIYLFFQPEVLYGSPNVQIKAVPDVLSQPTGDDLPAQLDVKESITTKEAPFRNELISVYTHQLDDYMEKEMPYKTQGLVIGDLSKQLHIPLHHLSYLLNSHYQRRFTDFINEYRVGFIMQRFQEPNWKDYTFEGLANEAGFSSRSNFFNAFKKITGLSPSDYLKQQKNP